MVDVQQVRFSELDTVPGPGLPDPQLRRVGRDRRARYPGPAVQLVLRAAGTDRLPGLIIALPQPAHEPREEPAGGTGVGAARAPAGWVRAAPKLLLPWPG